MPVLRGLYRRGLFQAVDPLDLPLPGFEDPSGLLPVLPDGDSLGLPCLDCVGRYEGTEFLHKSISWALGADAAVDLGVAHLHQDFDLRVG